MTELWTWADDRSPALLAEPVQGDFLPWWSHRDLRIRFFRPLPSLLHDLDHALYGRRVGAWHGTQLAIWALLIVAVLGLYRELGRHAGLGPGVAVLAGLIFAVDECHAWNVTWLAARHSLLSVLFSALALHAYLRFRRCRTPIALGQALIAFALALLSSEVAVSVLAWVALYELCLATEPWRRRLRAAGPMIAVGTLYLGGYALLGYGARHSGWYLDPTADPLRFARALASERLPALLHGLLTPIPAEVGPVFGATSIWAAALVFASLVVAILLRHGLRHPVWRFVAAATLASILPTAAAVPINYLLLLPSVGFAWLLAFVLADLWRYFRDASAGSRLRRSGWAATAVLLALVHLALAPLAGFATIGVLQRTHERPARTLTEAELPSGETARSARVLVCSMPSPLLASYLPVSARFLVPDGKPAAIWSLSSRPEPPAITRIDDRTFDLAIAEPGLLADLWDRTTNDGLDLAEGQTFQRGALSVGVRKASGGRILAARFRVDRDLDSDEVWLLYWDGERLARFEPPPVGTSRRLTLRRAEPGPRD